MRRLFQVERKKLEKMRLILLAMLRNTVPTANVNVILGLHRSRIAVGGRIGAPAQSGPNDNTVLTGTIILTGTVFETEKISLIVDMANAVFGGVARPVASNTNANQSQQQGQAAPQQPQTGTVIGPLGPGQQLGNRITIINNLRLAGPQQVELGVVMAVVNRSEAPQHGL